MKKFIAAAVQLNSTENKKENLEKIALLVKEAAKKEAERIKREEEERKRIEEEKRKAEALEHFRKMEILMKDEIGQSVKETKAYGGNGFPIPHTGKKKI